MTEAVLFCFLCLVHPSRPAELAHHFHWQLEPVKHRSILDDVHRFDWKSATLTGIDATFTNLDIRATRIGLTMQGVSEANPLWRPFIHSKAAYAFGALENTATKALGDRMRRSPRRFVRDLWWLPQVASAGAHLQGYLSWRHADDVARCWHRFNDTRCF